MPGRRLLVLGAVLALGACTTVTRSRLVPVKDAQDFLWEGDLVRVTLRSGEIVEGHYRSREAGTFHVAVGADRQTVPIAADSIATLERLPPDTGAAAVRDVAGDVAEGLGESVFLAIVAILAFAPIILIASGL